MNMIRCTKIIRPTSWNGKSLKSSLGKRWQHMGTVSYFPSWLSTVDALRSQAAIPPYYESNKINPTDVGETSYLLLTITGRTANGSGKIGRCNLCFIPSELKNSSRSVCIVYHGRRLNNQMKIEKLIKELHLLNSVTLHFCLFRAAAPPVQSLSVDRAWACMYQRLNHSGIWRSLKFKEKKNRSMPNRMCKCILYTLHSAHAISCVKWCIGVIWII